MDPKNKKKLGSINHSKNISFSITDHHVHIALPRGRSRSRLSMQNLLFFNFNPGSETFANPLPVPAGLHSFIQMKNEPYTIYCRLNRNYLNTATTIFVEHFVGLEEEDIFTAGEMIVDAAHKIVAWSFYSPLYAEDLRLTDAHIIPKIINKKPSKLDLCGLPIDKFYFSNLWHDFTELNFTASYFDDEGHFKSFPHDEEKEHSQVIVPARFTSLYREVSSASRDFNEEKSNQSSENTVHVITPPLTLLGRFSPVSDDFVSQGRGTLFHSKAVVTEENNADVTSNLKLPLPGQTSV